MPTEAAVQVSAGLRSWLTQYKNSNPTTWAPAYQRIYNEVGSQLDPSRKFWLQQAIGINGASNLASIFIRSHTAIGLAMAGKPVSNSGLQHTSNDIALAFVSSVIDTGGMPTFRDILEFDVYGAITGGGVVDFAGWGGSFFYWDQVVTYPGGQTSGTIGNYIFSNPERLDRFVDTTALTMVNMIRDGDLDVAGNFSDSLRAAWGGFNLPAVVFWKIYLKFQDISGATQHQVGWDTSGLRDRPLYEYSDPLPNFDGGKIVDGNQGLAAQDVVKFRHMTLKQQDQARQMADLLRGLAYAKMDIEDLQRNAEAGRLGQQLGSVFSQLVPTDNVFERVLVDGVFATIGENLFEALDAGGLLLPLRTEGAFNILSDLPQELVSNLVGAGVGALSSYLAAELIDALGMEGTVAGDLATSVGAQAIGQIISNLPTFVQTGSGLFAGVTSINVGNIFASYAGGKLADAVWKPSSAYGQIGASVGQGIGAIRAAMFLKMAGFNVYTLAAAIVIVALNKVMGGFIGSLFGASKSYATVTWDDGGDAYTVTDIHAKRGGSRDAAAALASSVAEGLNGVLEATGGLLLGESKIAPQFGMRNNEYVYWNRNPGGQYRSKDIGKIISAGMYDGFTDMVERLAGGDIYAKRVLAAELRMTDYTTFDPQSLIGDLAIAADYAKYLVERTTINALIAAEPGSAFAAGWALTFARVKELGLYKRSFTDWIGGWNVFLDEVGDSFIDGISIPVGIVRHVLEEGQRRYHFVDEAGEVIAMLGDQIDERNKTRIKGSAAADTIQISGDRLLFAQNVTSDDVAVDAAGYVIPVAALVDAGAGDDVVRTGDLGNDVLGGAGNDRIVGGKLDDWLFGEAGDDTLFAGDVVSAGVVGQAALEAGGTLVVDAVAASAVDGGNGDLLDGGEGNDRLYGGRGSEWLRGGDGVDLLVGGAGGDILEGGAGDDQQAGGAAAILGGAGSDQYVFGYGDGADVLFDESDPAGVAGATGDSFYNRLDLLNTGALTRNWAGKGDYEVDGSVKGGEDAIVFGVGVGMQNLIMKRSGANGQDLVIQLTADDPAGILVNGHVRQILTGDSLTIKDWFESTRKVEWLRFANGDEVRIGDMTSYIVGVAGQSVILGTNGADWIVGTDDADKIYGLNGDDFGFGGLGNDLVSGDANNDLVAGGNGDDIVVGGAGNDTVLGDGGRDHLLGGVGHDIVAGGKGDDTVVAGGGNDVIRYARGDGADVVIDDLINNWDQVWVDGNYVNGYRLGPNGTIVKDEGSLQSPITTVYFDGSNWINGADYDYDAATRTLRRHKGAVNGVISGDVALGGSDTLEFGVGIDIQDLLLRRVGNDLEITVSDVDATSGFAGAGDKITIKDWWSASTGLEQRPIERFSFLATGLTVMADFKIVGGVSDSMDTTMRSSSADWITGGGGDDTIAGDGGDDLLSGGAGADTLNGGAGKDILYGGTGDDSLQGGDEADQLFGGVGTDIAFYRTGNITGGRTVVRAYLGAAWANGGAAIGDVYDSIEGLEGGLLADRLGGNAGDNVLRAGGAMVDLDLASDGVDRLFGGAGDDIYVYSSIGAAEIREGALQVEEIRNASGALTAGFTATWQYMRYGAVQGGGTYYQYQLTVRRDATGEVVYSSIDGADFLYTTPQGLPTTAAWASGAGQWKNGATASGNGRQVTVEKIVAGSGGLDTLAMDEAGVGLSRLGFARNGADLNVLVDGVVKVKLVNQTTADSAVETVLLADGLSLDLTKLRLSDAEATAGEDVLIGGAAQETLRGQDGDDIISGGGGDDWLEGGAGNDNLEGGAGADYLDGGDDSLTAGLAIDPTKPAAYGDTVRYSGSANAVTIDLKSALAMGGDATNDTIVVVDGVSTIENVVGSLTGADNLSGDHRANRLFGLGGDDVLDGREGDDVLIGGDGADTLFGREGDDALTGEDGGDRLEGGVGNDFLAGGAGGDTLLGGADKDQLLGDDGDDLLYGEADDDQLSGDAGVDLLYGGDGADTLVGGTGDDQLDGGAGDDVYGFDANSGLDTVIDTAGANKLSIVGVSADRIWLTRSGNDLRVAVIGGSSVITVKDYYAATGAGRVKEIEAADKSLFLGHAQALIDAMTAASTTPPATVPAAVATLATSLWQTDRTPAPTALGQTYTINEDVVLAGQALVTDIDDNVRSYALVGQPPLGEVNLNATTGAWTYTPKVNVNGVDTFVITVTDANNQTAQQTVSVTIQPVNDGPVLTGPTALTVSEATAAGGFVAAFSSIDPDAGDTNTFTLDNDGGGRFAISPTGVLSLKPGVSLNYEAATSHVIRVRVRDVAGAFVTRDVTVTVENANEAPTALSATGLTIAENKVADAFVATLTAVDPDAGDTIVFSLVDDLGGRFKIVGNKLYTGATKLDFEAATSHVVTVVATDRGGLTFSRSFTVTVTNVNEKPTYIGTEDLVPIAENSAAGTVLAHFWSTDPDVGDTRTFSLTSDAGGWFAITPAGELTIKAGAMLDYETAKSHSITVKVTDAGGLAYSKAFTINVANVQEAPNAPALLTAPNVLVAEGAALGGLTVATFDLTDPDKTVPVLQLVADAQNWLEIVPGTGTVRFKAGLTLNFETLANAGWTLSDSDGNGALEAVYTAQLRAKDATPLYSPTIDLVIRVEDVNEAPTGLTLTPTGAIVYERDRIDSLDANAAPAIKLGTLNGQDPDLASTAFGRLTYGTADSRFTITSNELWLNAGAMDLNFEASQSFSVVVTVTDGGGRSLPPQTLTFSLTDRDDFLRGGNGNDFYEGQSGRDQLFGNVGDDVLNGNAGNDDLWGGLGVDILRGGIGNDLLKGEDGDDVLNGDDGNDNLDGYIGADSLKGGAGADILDGGEGDDVLIGGAGADQLKGGPGYDTLSYEGSEVGVSVNLATKAVSGGDAAGDVIVDAFDKLVGSGAGDVLVGSTAVETIDGGAGNDQITGGGGQDLLYGGTGDDTINGDAEADTIYGGDGVDRLYGGAGADKLYGDDGDDWLYAGSDGDLLDGGTGNDYMEGGIGSDEYIVRATSGHDRIVEFDPTGADQDTVNFAGLTHQQLWLQRIGDDLKVTVLDKNSSVTVVGWFTPPPPGSPANTQIEVLITNPKVTVQVNELLALMDLQRPGNSFPPGTAGNPPGPPSQNDMDGYLSGDNVFKSKWAELWKINAAPTVNAIGALETDEDVAKTVTIAASDDYTATGNLRYRLTLYSDAARTQAVADGVKTLSATADGQTLSFTTKDNLSGLFYARLEVLDRTDRTTTRDFQLTVKPVSDTPGLQTFTTLSGTLDTGSLVLGDIPATLGVDKDGSETLDAVMITGLGLGLSLNKGQRQDNNSWRLAASELTGLVLTGATTWYQDLALTVTAYSHDGTAAQASSSQSWTIVINARPTDLAANAASVNETTAAGAVANNTVLTTFTRTDADGAADTPKYSLIAAGDGKTAGADGRFSIDQNTGQLRLANNSLLNYEAAASHLIRVLVTDSGNLTYNEDFTVTVNDVNEAPTVSAFTGSLSEAAAVNAVVGTVSYTDPDTASVNRNPVFALSGTGASKFAISGAGVITYAGGSIDYETQPQVYTLTLTTTDKGGSGYTVTSSVTINVTDANDPPTVGAFTGSLSEAAAVATVVGTVSYNDPDVLAANRNPVFSLSGTGSTKFAISNAGVITYAGGSIDYETQSQVYNLTVTVRDQGGAGYLVTAPVTINITDANDAPTVGAFTGSISELAAVGAQVGTVSYSDPDVLAANRNPVFSLSGTGATKFAISSTGVITYASGSIDYETQPHAYNLTVTVTDKGGAGLSASAAVTINVTDANEAPSIPSVSQSIALIGENAADQVFATYSASDPESVPTLYESFDPLDLFYMSGNQLRLRGGLNFETLAATIPAGGEWWRQNTDVDGDGRREAAFAVGVMATDGVYSSADHAWAWVYIEDVNEAPSIPTVAQSIAIVGENAADQVFATYSASDPESVPTLYESFDPLDLFYMSGNQLRLRGGLDFETLAATIPAGGEWWRQNTDADGDGRREAAFAVGVMASDGVNTSPDHAWAWVYIEDVNDAPSVALETQADGAVHASEALSWVGPGQTFGKFYVSDQDLGDTWSVSVNDGGLNIFSASLRKNADGSYYRENGKVVGQFIVHGAINYEVRTSYSVTLDVWDNSGAHAAAQPVTIKVDNENDAPTISATIVGVSQGAFPNGSGKDVVFTGADVDSTGPFTWRLVSWTNNSGSLSGPIAPTGPVYSVSSAAWRDAVPSPYRPGLAANYYVTWEIKDAGGALSQSTFLVQSSAVSKIAPVVLDLDGDGVRLVETDESFALFDQDGDGMLDDTGWFSPGDGVLVLDRDRNGQIDDGSEISFSSDLEGAQSDLEGLRAYDTDDNGFFDSQDARFSEFQIWRDANEDGLSQAGELFSLADLNIVAIDLNLTLNPVTGDPEENHVYGTSRFIRGDGTTGEVGDVLFAYQGAPTVTLVSTTSNTQPTQGLLPPVVIDLDGDGVELVSRAASTVRFDVAGDGKAVRTGWVGADDAFLALDRDGDGKISSGKELSFTGDLAGAASDLEGLQAFDSNANGFLDAQDARFGEFRVWQDRNQDGVSQADELLGLGQLGVRALNLTGALTGASLASAGENVLYATSDLVKTDGSRLAVGDVMLAFGDHPVVAVQNDVAEPDSDRFDPIARKYGSPDPIADAAARAAASAPSDGLDTVDRTATSTKSPKPPLSQGDDTVRRPDVDLPPASAAGDLPEVLAPRSWSQIDLAGILDAAVAPSSGLMAVDYDAVIGAPSPSAADDNLALAQQTRLRMIQAMAGFSREGAADLGPDAWRQGHAQSLALLTALPDVRGR